MPIYEEKLISPLAIRFTQEHIKTLFRDGHVVEETTAQIEAEPGSGDYDIVLRVPFPTIEIIRWSAPGAKETDRHWFTLDNRRLYCLQRAAAKYWPKRVGAVVEILYADPGAVRKKYDSTTFGCTVTVSPSCKVAMLFRWDWRAEVTNAKFVSPLVEVKDDRQVWEVVVADDKKDNTDELADVPGRSDSAECTVARAREALAAKVSGSASSTATPSSEDEDSSDERRSSAISDGSPFQKASRSLSKSSGQQPAKPSKAQPQPQQATKRRSAATGSKTSSELAARAVSEITAQLRADGDGRVRVPRWNDRYGEPMGGVGMRLFLESHPEAFTVLVGKSGQWTVKLVEDRPASGAKPGASASSSKKPSAPSAAPSSAAAPPPAQAAASSTLASASAPAPSAAASAAIVERAAAEIRAQLDPSGSPSYVHIPDWNRRYLRHLGQLRDFAESRPDLFIVVACGKGFRVACTEMFELQKGALAAQLAMQRMVQMETLMATAQLLAAQSAYC